LNIHGVNDIRHTEFHTAELVVPEPSVYEVEMVIEKLKSKKIHHVLIKSQPN